MNEIHYRDHLKEQSIKTALKYFYTFRDIPSMFINIPNTVYTYINVVVSTNSFSLNVYSNTDNIKIEETCPWLKNQRNINAKTSFFGLDYEKTTNEQNELIKKYSDETLDYNYCMINCRQQANPDFTVAFKDDTIRFFLIDEAKRLIKFDFDRILSNVDRNSVQICRRFSIFVTFDHEYKNVIKAKMKHLEHKSNRDIISNSIFMAKYKNFNNRIPIAYDDKNLENLFDFCHHNGIDLENLTVDDMNLLKLSKLAV